MLWKKLAIAVLISSQAVGAAFATQYHCEIDRNKANESLPPDVVVWYNENTASVKVLDGHIQDMIGKPIKAKLAVDNNKKVSFTYKLSTVAGETTGGKPVYAGNLAFRLSIKKPSLNAVFSMKPVGFRNSFRAKGQCKVL